MSPHLWAAGLFPLFLVGLAQPTQKMKLDCYKGVTGTIYEYGALTLNEEEYVQFQRYAGKHVLFVNYPGKNISLSSPSLSTVSSSLSLTSFHGLVAVTTPPYPNLDPLGKTLLHCRYVRPGGGFVPNFQLFEKGDVNGEKEQKVFTFLKNSCPPTSDLLGSSNQLFWEPMKVHDIRWNFEKFLVGPDGVPVMRWFHKAPISAVKADILEYLKQFQSE
uniref:Glutathione peroxidase 6 n=1 Tax=Neovison vison TaxID=452646 RepID=A0A8C7BBN2_NEOVI